MNKKLKEGFLVCFSRVLSFTHLAGKTGRLAELKSELVCPVRRLISERRYEYIMTPYHVTASLEPRTLHNVDWGVEASLFWGALR